MYIDKFKKIVIKIVR